MKKVILRKLQKYHSKQQSITYKIISLLFGMILFLIILPAFFVYIVFLGDNYLHIELNRGFELALSILTICLGLFFMLWTTVVQWKIGKGIPTPNAPTQHLVISGPYKLCRNPIELGAIFYYLGVGTIIGGLFIGIICFLLGLIVGSIYHKYIEENELEDRFGDEYRKYKQNTPFLFPRLFRR